MNIRYQLKTPYRNDTTYVIFIPGFLPSIPSGPAFGCSKSLLAIL